MPIFDILLAFVLGFLVAIAVNLLADYLPARYIYWDARRNPFSTTTPKAPRLLPRSIPPFWSGIVALLALQQPSSPPRWGRRIAVEILLPIAFALITAGYGDSGHVWYYLFYAACFTLIAVIDIEYRWILWDTLIPLIVVVIVEIVRTPRLNLDSALIGAVAGLLITGGLWLMGRAFGALLSRRAGSAVGRTVFGSGDVYLATVGGLMLGWPNIGVALLVMMISGGVAAAALLLSRRLTRKRDQRLGRRRPRFAAIPYGPHVLIGILALLFFPDTTIQLLLTLIAALRGGR